MMGWRLVTEKLARTSSIAEKTVLSGADLGLGTGVSLPITEFRALDGTLQSVLRPNGTRSMLVFVSTTCPACKSLAPSLSRVMASSLDVSFLILVAGELVAVREFANHAGIPENVTIPTTIAEMRDSMGLRYYPFAYVVDRGGRIGPKGLIGDESHMLRLIETS